MNDNNINSFETKQPYFDNTQNSRPQIQHLDLTELGKPVVGQIDGEELTRQSHIFRFLNKAIQKTGEQKSLYRLGSVTLSMENNNTITGHFTDHILEVPLTIENGHFLVQNEVQIQNQLGEHVVCLLQKHGHLDYLKNKGLFNSDSDWQVVVDVDIYHSRNKGQVGFHKDTNGHSLFVVLAYNNKYPIPGPECVWDTRRIGEHVKHLSGKQPQKVLDDISKFLSNINVREIMSTIIECYGYIIFPDEIINHSTPSRESRAVSLREEKDALFFALPSEVRLRWLIVDLFQERSRFSQLEFDKAGLESWRLNQKCINALICTQGAKIKGQEIKEYLSVHFSGYVDQTVNDVKFMEFIELMQSNDKIYPEQLLPLLVSFCHPQSIFQAFKKIGKPNMSEVNINDCQPTMRNGKLTAGSDESNKCHVVESKNHGSLLDNGNILKRQNSREDIRSKLPPENGELRQFLRFWVQLIPRHNHKSYTSNSLVGIDTYWISKMPSNHSQSNANIGKTSTEQFIEDRKKKILEGSNGSKIIKSKKFSEVTRKPHQSKSTSLSSSGKHITMKANNNNNNQ